MTTRQTQRIRVEHIHVGSRHRQVPNDAVDRLARSMDEIGLRTPITVRIVDEMEIDGEIVEGVPVLVTGATRLAAAKSLGLDHIDCFVEDCDDIDAELWEIAENLHRADLTAQERDEHIAAWIRLTEEKQRVLLQSETKPSGGRPESGVRAAARDLGIDSTDAHRAMKTAGLSEQAKQAARDARLDNNRTVLLKAARETTPEAQVAAIHAHAQRPRVLVDAGDPDMKALAIDHANKMAGKFVVGQLQEYLNHLTEALEAIIQNRMAAA